MPYINIRLIDDGVSAGQKSELIRQITDVMVNVLNKDPATTFVVIDEIKTENWGVSGESVAHRRSGLKGG